MPSPARAKRENKRRRPGSRTRRRRRFQPGSSMLETHGCDGLCALRSAGGWIDPMRPSRTFESSQPEETIMKTSYLPLIAALTLGVSLPALAGPDFQAIEKARRSEEHTSELQSQSNLVCRLLLEKKKKKTYTHTARLHQHRVQRHINVILGGGVIHCDALSPRHIDTVI